MRHFYNTIPVPFDTVLNQSTHSWAWGSPDIVNIFSGHDHITGYTYPPELEDFSTENADYLDKWVLDQFETFITNSSNIDELDDDGVILFLHLLGSDTNGHAHKPHSNQYKENVNVVDGITKRVEELVKKRFRDDKTVFIVTADHGMTDWGSHGAGSEHETLTPFLTWGAGIKPRLPGSCDDFTGFLRDDEYMNIEQIDIASFISALISIPTPSNSLGKLPYHLVETNPENLNKMLEGNCLEYFGYGPVPNSISKFSLWHA